MKKNLRPERGFTMVEMFIAVGFMIVLGTVGAVNLFGFRAEREVSSTAQQIATVLREAESRAISQSQGMDWGVRFENDAQNPYFGLFSGNAYNTSTRVSYHRLPKKMAYSTSTVPLGDAVDVVFAQVIGKPKVVITTSTPQTDYSQLCVPVFDPDPPHNQIDCIYPTVLVRTIASVALPLSVSVFRGSGSGTSPSTTIIVNNSGSISFNAINCTLTCTQAPVVFYVPPPAVVISADPVTIRPNESTLISWSSLRADTCAASSEPSDNSWSGPVELAGSLTINPRQTTSFSLTCTGAGGSMTQSRRVHVVTQRGETGNDNDTLKKDKKQ